MSINWQAFVEMIHQHSSFILTSHIRPDCDALGSELGMAAILRTLGKDVQIVNAHRTPPALQFLDPASRIDVLGETIEPEDVRRTLVHLGDPVDVAVPLLRRRQDRRISGDQPVR